MLSFGAALMPADPKTHDIVRRMLAHCVTDPIGNPAGPSTRT